jgi:hypothetical protein
MSTTLPSFVPLPPICLPGLTVETLTFPKVSIAAGKKTANFWAEYCKSGTPQQVQMALLQAKDQARKTGLLPLVIAPYLSEERLIVLEKAGVSGIDLCGNGAVVAPGIWFFRTGFPNRFKSTATIKNIYQGASSLVARVFLAKQEYASVGDIQTEIRRRGGEISLGTVSKVLKELEEEIIVGRASGTIRLLQPEQLLERLLESFTLPKSEASFVGKVALDIAELEKRLGQIDDSVSVVRTGVGSLDKYVTMATQPKLSLYTSSLSNLLTDLDATPTTRFPNLEIIETNSPLPFFDTQKSTESAESLLWASPLQTYLEMMQGDERLQQTALTLRERLISGEEF